MSRTYTHIAAHDFRYYGLEISINAIAKSIKLLEKQTKDIYWYDALHLLDDSEQLFALAFIAFQNYINTSIKDMAGTLDNKNELYKVGQKLNNKERTKIELIIALTNYAKHKDSPELHRGTKTVLEYFRLNDPDNINTYSEFLISEGLSLLNKKQDITSVLKVLKIWRANLFSKLEKEGMLRKY